MCYPPIHQNIFAKTMKLFHNIKTLELNQEISSNEDGSKCEISLQRLETLIIQ